MPVLWIFFDVLTSGLSVYWRTLLLGAGLRVVGQVYWPSWPPLFGLKRTVNTLEHAGFMPKNVCMNHNHSGLGGLHSGFRDQKDLFHGFGTFLRSGRRDIGSIVMCLGSWYLRACSCLRVCSCLWALLKHTWDFLACVNPSVHMKCPQEWRVYEHLGLLRHPICVRGIRFFESSHAFERSKHLGDKILWS